MNIQQRLDAGMAHHRAGRLQDAEAIYRQVLAEQPNHADALQLLGSLAADAGQFDAAIDLTLRAIQINPNVAEYHSNLGAMYARRRQYDLAIDSLRRAIDLKPDVAYAHFNLGGALLAKFEFAAAVPVFQRALSLNRNWPEAWNNLGLALRNCGQYQDALAAFRRSIVLNPNFADSHWNLGLTLLVLGDLADGLREYEWGRKSPRVAMGRDFPQPRWKGEELAGKRIFIHADLGLGDTLNFIRYAPLLARQGAHVIVECQTELRRILQSVEGIEQIVVRGQALPAFDVHCPMTGLMLATGTTLETIPANVPYIIAAPDRVVAWNKRIGEADGRLRVGLAWSGRPDHKYGGPRAIPLRQFAPLAEIRAIRFFSLQKGPAAEEASAPPPGMSLADFSADLTDFSETAALLATLDMLICVDTSVAHLAGAMAKEVWVLVPFVPDWRWMLDRADTPWYPTMRLFRQKTIDDWPGVMAEVKRALAERRP